MPATNRLPAPFDRPADSIPSSTVSACPIRERQPPATTRNCKSLALDQSMPQETNGREDAHPAPSRIRRAVRLWEPTPKDAVFWAVNPPESTTFARGRIALRNRIEPEPDSTRHMRKRTIHLRSARRVVPLRNGRSEHSMPDPTDNCEGVSKPPGQRLALVPCQRLVRRDSPDPVQAGNEPSGTTRPTR